MSILRVTFAWRFQGCFNSQRSGSPRGTPKTVNVEGLETSKLEIPLRTVRWLQTSSWNRLRGTFRFETLIWHSRWNFLLEPLSRFFARTFLLQPFYWHLLPSFGTLTWFFLLESSFFRTLNLCWKICNWNLQPFLEPLCWNLSPRTFILLLESCSLTLNFLLEPSTQTFACWNLSAETFIATFCLGRWVAPNL